MTNHTVDIMTSSPSTQRGAVLIVVLLFLILIMVVGVIAVRNSTTDLKLATSDQINTVLLQSSDSTNSKIEQAVNGDPSGEPYRQIMSFTGIFGHYLLNDNADNDIIDFCYRPRSEFFNIDNAVIRRNSGKLVSNTTGYCDPSRASDYTSARNTVMTQVMIKNVSDNSNSEAFGHMNLGSDSETKTVKTQTFDVYSTSVLPAYGGADEDEINNCFKKDASDASDSVAKCMTDHNIPSKTLVQQVDVANTQNSDFCNYFGTSNTPATPNPLCSAP